MHKVIIFALLVWCSVCIFDPDFAKNLFQLNVATYCRPANVKTWTCKPCQDSAIQIKEVKTFFNSSGDILGVLGVAKNPDFLSATTFTQFLSLEEPIQGAGKIGYKISILSRPNTRTVTMIAMFIVDSITLTLKFRVEFSALSNNIRIFIK